MTQSKALAAGIAAVMLAVTTGCTSTPLIVDGPIYHPNGGVYYPNGKGDYKKHNGHKNKNKHKNKDYKKSDYNRVNAERLATRKLNSMGYRVEKVDYKHSQGIVKTKAYRGGQKYKIDLAYPSMNVVKMKRD
ncbi:hypothetical protein [Psychrobacter phenylpyruvicus]|uniref:PepSY domain-containing protein n=1 Tax=Psychrobacter phenylpyruvicus TaxID=29432 RepID=A0A379LJK2_9GAMM|nr:hypothetical protein [Psychrobacter phenylpyruvicus]SUD90796.1 Uncharacterised protein [Psychrobacter phenylpyruvicus]